MLYFQFFLHIITYNYIYLGFSVEKINNFRLGLYNLNTLKIYFFTGENTFDAICQICHINTINHTCCRANCGHFFCKECLNRRMINKSDCVECGKHLNEIYVNSNKAEFVDYVSRCCI